MPEAHESNAAGFQHFSATQTSAEVSKALADAYPDKYEYEGVDYTTAPAPGETPPADPNAPPAPDLAAAAPAVDPNAPQRKAKPGKVERQLARANSTIDEMRREMAELKGMVLGRQQSASDAPPAPAATPPPPPKVETTPAAPPAVEIPKFDKPRPRRDDFFDAADPEAAYEDAVTDWKIEGREFDKTARSEADKRQQEQQKQAEVQRATKTRWNEAIAEAKAELPDFDAAISKQHFDADKKPLPIINGPMDYLAKIRKTGPRILYWLATHPEEANKIAVKTFVPDPNDAWAVEEAMSEVRREYDRIEADLKANPPKPPVVQTAPGTEVPSDNEYDEFADDEELEVDPNLQPVTSDPAAGKKVEQAPSRGTVDTKPPTRQTPPAAPVVPKPEPVKRVGSHQTHVSRSIVDTPPEVVKQLSPEEYRRRRAQENSAAARG